MAVAIIDEFPIVRNGLRIFINDNFNNVNIIECKSISTLHDAYPDYRPDLIIISLNQNQILDNWDVINTVKKWYDLKTVIIFDEKADFSMISQYLEAGVYGYISKQSDLEEIVSCIKQVLSGRRYIDMAITLNNWFPLSYKISSETNVRLTARQYQIAVYLIQGRKTSWIAQKLERKPSTISTVKKNIFTRFAIDNIISLREIILSNQCN